MFNITLSRIDGIMVSMFATIAADFGYMHWSIQAKDYKIGICCFSAKHTVLIRKTKDWFGPESE
jgi:hypothetical protein